ncbi:hypothetical protein NFI96_033814, partial [Prochilodus magdalenae]
MTKRHHAGLNLSARRTAALFLADRNQLSGKAQGAGLCVYTNTGWCTNCLVVNALCSEATEQLTVKCRPHYLPREFTAVFVIAVYIAPDANANNALKELHDNISSLQNKHPEAFYVVAGDFNHRRVHLNHLEKKNSYVRMLFVDFTPALNTMIPQTLTDKLFSLGLRSSLCNWVLDFLTNRPQPVRIHNLSSSTTILSTGSPQGCVLSPLLFTLLTYDCSPIHPDCHIVKFADDTAVVGCITNSDESGYRQK